MASADDELLILQEAKMVTQEEIDCRLASAELRGEARGADSKAREIAKAMLAEGMPLETVARIAGLSEAETQALK